MADGDGRFLFNMIEELYASRVEERLNTARLAEAVQRRVPFYDKARDSHFNLISALHKSLRGSDADASLYWLARMLSGGEDPNYIARRLVRFASEDVGLAEPGALQQTVAAWQAYERLGSPEGELALAQAVLYLATAPKSNAAYTALGDAMRIARESGSAMPPKLRYAGSASWAAPKTRPRRSSSSSNKNKNVSRSRPSPRALCWTFRVRCGRWG